MKRILLTWGILFTLTAISIAGEDNPIKVITLPLEDRTVRRCDYFLPYKEIKRPKIGLALSGGSARGIAQIGVLKVLEENNIPIDYIVGSSIGSIIGGLYAAGYSAEQIFNIAQTIHWEEIMVDTPPRIDLFPAQKEERARHFLQIRFDGFRPAIPSALTPGQRLNNILTDLTIRAHSWTSSDFDSLRIPFRAVTTDLVSGRKIVIESGDLAEAMLASSSIPLLFSPVERENMLLVDGGLVDNIPVDVTKQGGVDIVLAVDTSSKLREKNQLSAPWQIADQVAGIMQRERNQAQRAQADLVLRPDLNDRLPSDFSNLGELYQAGIQETKESIAAIKELIASRNSNNLDLSGIICPATVEIEGAIHIKKNLLLEQIRIRPNRVSKTEDILLDLESLYRLGFFSNVKAVVKENSGITSLTYIVEENPVLKYISIKGNTVIPDSSLLRCVKSRLGEVINHHQGKEDLRSIVALYHRNGYSLAHIAAIDFDYNKNILTITIEEGKIAALHLEGNKRTRDYVILREFPLRIGDIFNVRLANEGIANIYSTGLFDRAQLLISWKRSLPVLTIKLTEKKFTLLRIGAQYDRERRGRGFLEISDENLLGSGNKMTVHAQYGGRDQIFHLKFRADRIFKSYLTYDLDVHHLKSKHFTFDDGKEIGEYEELRTGVIFSLGQQVKRLGAVSVTGRLQRVHLRSIYGRDYPPGVTHLQSLSLKSIVDSQDRVPFPRRGKYHLFYYEIAGKYLGSEVSYFKIFSSLEFFSTLWEYHTFHSKLLWGTSDLTTPFCEQFRLGGERSFFGLREEELLGRRILLASLEYRFLLPFEILFDTFLNLRYDFGGIWKNSTVQIKYSDFIHGIGGGISFATPLGPISFSYGRRDDGRDRFYFSAGYRF